MTRRDLLRHATAAVAVIALPNLPKTPGPREATKVILDTDIGGDVDDVYALALLASLPGIKILGVTTAYGQPEPRAKIAAKLLKVMGQPHIPVYQGLPGPGGPGRQQDWAKSFASDSIRTDDPIAFMRTEIERAPNQVTLIGIGPLGNLAALFTRYPETAKKLKQVVLMAGAFYVGYNNRAPAEPEWNVASDVPAARTVFQSGAPLTVAGLDVTTMMQLDEERQKRLFALGTPLTDALSALTHLWGNHTPTLYDPFAVAYAAGHIFCDSEEQPITVDPTGLTRISTAPPNAKLLVHPQKDAFLDWYIQALAPR